MSTILKFKILHGSETDNEAFVFENTSGLREIMTTINGKETRLSVQDVEEKIKETEDSLAGLKRAKELLANT
jgi:hypothetical protein